MTRELSLVIVGASMLTGGYLAWPEPDFDNRAEAQAESRVGGRGTSGSHLVFISRFGHSGMAGGTSRAAAGVSRGGLGATGARIGGAMA